MIKLFRILWLLGLLVTGFYLTSQLVMESNILKLLPKYQSQQTNAVIDKVTESLNKNIILMAEMPQNENSLEAYKKSLHELQNSGFFKYIYYQVDIKSLLTIHHLFSPYKSQLISHSDIQWLGHGTDDELSIVVDLAQEQLYGLSAINAEQLAQDPLFIFQRHLNQLNGFSDFEFDTSSGYFEVTKETKKYYFAFLELNESAYAPQIQNQVNHLLTSLNPASATPEIIKWYSFGTVRYASEAFHQAKREISTVGLGSLIGITFLFVMAFRSLTPLLMSVAVIATGLMVALAVTSTVFGHIHVFAMVFGSTIAGVSIDYCFHYLIESQVDNSAQVDIKKLSTPLLIGFGSSALVYLGFTITGYQVLAQISVFSIAGLLAVLIQVLLFFPLLIRGMGRPSSKVLTTVSGYIINNPLARFCASPSRLLLVFVVLLSLLFVYYQPNDDIRALQSLSSQLKQEENKIKSVLEWQQADSYLLFQSETIDEVLQQEQRAIINLRAQGYEITGISDVVPTLKQQKHNTKQYQAISENNVVQNYLSNLGLSLDVKENTLSADEILNNEALLPLIKQRYIGQVAGYWTLLIPVDQRLNFSGIKNATLIQQAKDTSSLFAEFRVKSTWMLTVTVLTLLLVLYIFRYRFTVALTVVLIPVVAGLMAVLSSQLMGFHISLFSVLALLLVLGMGIDYVVFLKESKHPEVIMKALLLSACTTILAFGLLVFSQVAVISSFGITVGVGIILVLIMSPAVSLRSKGNE